MAIQITLTEVENRYEQIRDRATTPQQKENLHKIHSILKSMISNNIKPTMSGLIKHLNSKGPSIKASTIYNARDKGNLYRELYDAWELHWYTKKKIPLKVTPNGDHTFPDIVNHDDLNSITDDVLKYRITLLLNEYKNLKNQNNLLRNKIVSAPIKQTLVDPVNKILTKSGNYLDLPGPTGN